MQHFGRECKKTWGTEVIALVVGGLSGALTSYLRSSGRASFTNALIDGLFTAAIFFAIYIFVHLLRSPWLERKSEGVRPSLVDGILGGILLFLLIASCVFISRLVAQDMRSEITLHAPADDGVQKAHAIIDLQNCKANLEALTKPEPKDSLRRRTIKLVNDLVLFWSERPLPPQQPVPNPTTDDERIRNAAWDRYWQDVTAAYTNKDFKDRILGIVREYKAKGIPTGYLEQATEQPGRLIGAVPYGGYDLNNCDRYENEACQIRELAFHVDATDKRIDSPDF